LGKVVKLESRPRPAGINPAVKGWIDNVIVPTLVREYLASEPERSESASLDAPMVECTDTKASPEEVQ
jgi:hypothetical protein